MELTETGIPVAINRDQNQQVDCKVIFHNSTKKNVNKQIILFMGIITPALEMIRL